MSRVNHSAERTHLDVLGQSAMKSSIETPPSCLNLVFIHRTVILVKPSFVDINRSCKSQYVNTPIWMFSDESVKVID